MTKIKAGILVVLLMAMWESAVLAQPSYTVQYKLVDAAERAVDTSWQTSFPSQSAASAYLARLPALLYKKGYVTASFDGMQMDSLKAEVQIFLGHQYKWARIATRVQDNDILQAVRWNDNLFSGALINFSALQDWQERMLSYLEEQGHPFARIFIDSLVIGEAEVQGLLHISRGPVYKIDSIRLYGNARVKNEFLQHYLDLPNGSVYNKKKLEGISKKLSQLPYLEEEKPADLTLVATGSILNLYVKAKKNSQINMLIGLLPNSSGDPSKRFQVAGEANILLRNALSGGETIGLNWQQLQASSPRLNLLYEHPYVFQSRTGLSFRFDMFRKDSTFLNVDMTLGANYGAGEVQSATVFLQRRQSIVNGINTAQVFFTRRLPQEADVKSNNIGVTYRYINTDNRLNPQRGIELVLTTSAGIKRIKKSNQILELKDPAAPSFKFESLYDTVKLKTYQLRVSASGAKYFPIGKQSVFKTGLQGGIFQSGNIFRNELFQIGGYKLLRGFDEESQYVSQYAVATLEYRYLIGRNSNFFAFTDGGWGKHLQEENRNHTYLSTGLGLSFETKAGIFNLVWAVGKRNDTELNLRQSRIHLGFVNYF